MKVRKGGGERPEKETEVRKVKLGVYKAFFFVIVCYEKVETS